MSDGMETVNLIEKVLDYECSVDDAITIETMMFKNLTKQLADSQQECDRLKKELEASDWVGEQACKAIESAIKITARECIEAIEKQHGGLGLAFTLRQRYGLDG